MRKRLRIYISMLAAVVRATALAATVSAWWFGHIKYATPVVHTDDHRDLARQALAYLIKSKAIGKESQLARHRAEVETACGMLDLVESDAGRTPGRLQWEYSHMYDPLARRGIDDRRYVNAQDEFIDWWERALMHARISNPAKAFTFLGYCCHLLQDMAVPSHTHCINHGLKTRMADNLELVSSSRRFHLREPAGAPYPGEEEMHLSLFVALGEESRGLEPGLGESNEIAPVIVKYYQVPAWTAGGWAGEYLGDPYYPIHRLLPSSPRIDLIDVVTLRNYLMCAAAERTAQLIAHFADITGVGG
jgi:hypothetical protein